MSIYAELSQKPETPQYAAVWGQFPLINIAKKVGVSHSYLNLTFKGQRVPGLKLESALTQLAAQVSSEMAQ